MNIILMIDNYISNDLIVRKQNEKLKKAFALITHLGDAVFHIPLFACFYYSGGAAVREFVVDSVLASLIGVAVLYALRMSVKRRRPIGDMPDEFAIVPVIEKYSFPSGHAMRNFIFPVMIYPLYGAWASALLACFAAVVVSARVYLRLHYPSDIFAGAALGIASAAAVLKYY